MAENETVALEQDDAFWRKAAWLLLRRGHGGEVVITDEEWARVPEEPELILARTDGAQRWVATRRYIVPVLEPEKERSDEKAAPGSLRIYLAGPMRGIPEFNHPAFNAATAMLREAGHQVFNPAEYDRSNGHDFAGHDGTEDLAAIGFSLRRALGTDLAWITAKADAVVVLPGWEKSLGAQAEAATARALGLPVCEIGAFLADGRAASPLAAELDGPEMPGQLPFDSISDEKETDHG